MTGRSGLAGSMLRRSGLAAPACKGAFSKCVLAHPPPNKAQRISRNRPRIAVALCFGELDDQRVTGQRAADGDISVGRGVSGTGQRDDVIVGLDDQLDLGLADDVAAGDDVADVVRVKGYANVFHDDAPSGCRSLTKNFTIRNTDPASRRIDGWRRALPVVPGLPQRGL